jgi:O-antigen/teichoic acid export membrane protein
MTNKSNNTVQALWVGLGSLSSFALGIVSAAILSRYFDKAEYGTYKQILYVYHTLLVVFTPGFVVPNMITFSKELRAKAILPDSSSYVENSSA